MNEYVAGLPIGAAFICVEEAEYVGIADATYIRTEGGAVHIENLTFEYPLDLFGPEERFVVINND